MTEHHEIITMENKTILLERGDSALSFGSFGNNGDEKLLILYATLKRMTKLMGLLSHCSLEMHSAEVCQVFGYYFVEKEGEKKKKHQMSVRLNDYNRFLIQLTKLKDLNTHFYFYYSYHLKALERVLKNTFPDDFSDGQINGLEELKLEVKEK